MKRVMTLGLLMLTPMSAAAQPAADLPPPEATEIWRPVAKVTPGAAHGAAPSDAVVLTSLSAWQSVKGGQASWTSENGELAVAPGAGDIQTTETFGDAQIHIEWMSPDIPAGRTGQGRANSGLYIQGRYEIQILESVEGETYANGQAGAVYKQHIPLVNPGRPAPQWQAYDIVYTAPRFAADGTLAAPARMTVFFNGVLIHNNIELRGPTVYRGEPAYAAHGPGPLLLQDHGDKVRFRNIWVRRLD